MHEEKKQLANQELPKDLPMPSYNYQVPANETFTHGFELGGKESTDDAEEKFCLQNFKLAI